MASGTDRPPCDTCGAPATRMMRDLVRRDTGKGYWTFGYAGPARAGCDAHPPSVSCTFSASGVNLGPNVDPDGRPIFDGSV